MKISNASVLAMDADIESVRSNKRYDLIGKINFVGGRETGWFNMENTLVLSVSYGVGCYRHIKISSNATLFELHEIILESFGFDDDHMHVFFMNNHAWDETEAYYTPVNEEANKHTTDYKLSDFKLEKGSKFVYIFDFGDEHKFAVKVLRCEDEKTDAPKVVKSVGENPGQYPDYADEDFDENNGLLKEYAEAAVNLYGAISIDEFAAIFNSQNAEQTDKKEVISELSRGRDAIYLIHNGYLVHFSFAEDNFGKLDAFLRTCAGKPRYVPAAVEFVKYAEIMYSDNPIHMAKLRLFLERIFGVSDETISLYKNIYEACRREASIQEIERIVTENNKAFDSAADFAKFVNILTELMNNTHTWSNNGYTPEQMVQMMRHHTVRSVKIGRNDPCPCGSGKKYKKCCGR